MKACPLHRTLVFAAVLVVSLIVPALAATTADAAQRDWARRYPASSGFDTWTEIAKGPSGTVYVAGVRNMEALGQRMIVAKYTASGRRVWLRSFKGKGWPHPAALAVNRSGQAFVAGSEFYPGGGNHLFVMKLRNKDGRRAWLRRYDGPAPTGDDFAQDVALGPRGAVYVGGATTTTASRLDALIQKYVDKGSLAVRAWSRTYRGAGVSEPYDNDFAERVLVDGKGRVFVGGFSETGVMFGRVTFVRRVRAATGKAMWTKRVALGADPRVGFSDLELFPGGGVVVAGTVGPSVGTGYDGFVCRLKVDGGERFFALLQTADPADDELVYDLALDGAGDIAVAGELTDDVTRRSTAWVVHADGHFGDRWDRTYASADPDDPARFSRVVTGPGSAVFCAGPVSSGFITGYDFTVVKYSAGGDRLWVDAYDDYVDSDGNKRDECRALLNVGGSKPGLYGAGFGGATASGEALLVKYHR